jgi:tetratricopeptide (TPR) repeat protein
MEETTQEEQGFNINEFIEKNKKPIIIGLGAVILIVGGLIGYSKYIKEPKSKEGMDEIVMVQEYFKQDSFALILRGDLGFKSAPAIAKEYSGTKAGNLANYYTGVSYLHTGEYDKSIEYLKKYKGNDDILTGAVAFGAIGDAYVEKGELAKGAEYYDKAYNYNSNPLNGFKYSKKAAQVYIKLENYDKAIAILEDALTKYKGKSGEIETEKYLGYAKALGGKYSAE